jgi:hypothetical protein
MKNDHLIRTLYSSLRIPIVFAAFGAILLVLQPGLIGYLIEIGQIGCAAEERMYTSVLNLFSWGAIIFSIGYTIDRYLRYSETVLDISNSGIKKDINESMCSELTERIDSLQNKIDEVSMSSNSDFVIDENKKKELVERITKTITEKGVNEIAAQAEASLVSKLSANTFNRLRDQYTKSLNRMTTEVNALGRRGNINLLIGILTTLSGFVIFTLLVFDTTSVPSDQDYLTRHYLPRFSLVVLIETFAYFFLGLYRSSLSEIKYFQNEITNLESKYTALEQAVLMGEKATIRKTIESLMNTERNFLLKKGESTVDLEVKRLDESSHTKLIEVFTNSLEQAQNRLTKKYSCKILRRFAALHYAVFCS